AFFKALLFMAAGNVIHAAHDEQDMRNWGGIWNDMRRTSITFGIGALSLAGIIPFVGFWSKELVLGDTFSRFDPLALTLWVAGFTFFLAYNFYAGRRWSPAAWRARLGFLPSLLERKYYFDEIYDAAFVRPMDWLARSGLRWVDRPLIDGAVMGVANVTENSA